MKQWMNVFKTGFLAVLMIALQSGLHAQSPKFQDAMTKALAGFDTIQSADGMMDLANKFERIALAEKNQWLPYYYSGLCRATASFMYNDVTRIDALMEVAEKHAGLADSLSPSNSEVLTLRSMILGARIMVDPMTRGQQYGMQSMMLLQQAMNLDPNNPRPYYLMGQSLFYTPPQFGGGQAAGCNLLQTAKTKYAGFTPASPLHPTWGEEQVDQALKQCAETKDPVTGE